VPAATRGARTFDPAEVGVSQGVRDVCSSADDGRHVVTAIELAQTSVEQLEQRVDLVRKDLGAHSGFLRGSSSPKLCARAISCANAAGTALSGPPFGSPPIWV